MSAAQGGFTFAAINAADLPGFSTAVIAQLTVFADYIDTRLNDLMRDPAISQDLEQLGSEIRASLEMKLSVAFAEVDNRITRAEMRNEEIAQAGNRIVAEMATWTTQTTAMMQQTRLELDNVVQQAKVKFVDVETSQQQLRSQDTESLKSDFRTFASQADHRWQTLEARLDDLALPSVSTAQEDPWWNRDDPWWRPQTPWSGGVGAAPLPSEQSRVRFAMDADDELQPSVRFGSVGAVPPGFPEPPPAACRTTSAPDWQPPYTAPADSRPTWNGWQSQGHVSEFRVDTRKWKGAHLDLDAKPEGFRAWQDRARLHLSGGRTDIRKLLR